jgi:hypothetical protein
MHLCTDPKSKNLSQGNAFQNTSHTLKGSGKPFSGTLLSPPGMRGEEIKLFALDGEYPPILSHQGRSNTLGANINYKYRFLPHAQHPFLP